MGNFNFSFLFEEIYGFSDNSFLKISNEFYLEFFYGCVSPPKLESMCGIMRQEEDVAKVD